MLRIALWAVVMLILSIGKDDFQGKLRDEGEQVAAYVHTHIGKNAACPLSLDGYQTKYADPEIKRRIKYHCDKEGRPFLLYRPLTLPFDKFIYNFEDRTWQYYSD